MLQEAVGRIHHVVVEGLASVGSRNLGPKPKEIPEVCQGIVLLMIEILHHRT